MMSDGKVRKRAGMRIAACAVLGAAALMLMVNANIPRTYGYYSDRNVSRAAVCSVHENNPCDFEFTYYDGSDAGPLV